MTAFAAATDALFADPHQGRDVVYWRGGAGPARTVRGVLSAPDDTASFGDTILHSATVFLSLRVSEVPDLAEGDRVSFGGTDYLVQRNPRRDTLRLVWRAVLIPEDRE